MREGLDVTSPVSFFITDQLGSVSTTLWANGTMRSELRYNPWGEERYILNTTPTGSRYTSQRLDNTLGLYDYNARYYDPAIGRFISADTIIPDQQRLTALTVGFHETMFIENENAENRQILEFGPSAFWNDQQLREFGASTGPKNSQNLNRYTYVKNNPVSSIDPSGHEWTEIGRSSLTISQFNSLISDLRNWKSALEVETIGLGLGALIPGLGIPLALIAGFTGFEALQLDWLLDYLGDAVGEAELLANIEANELGLTGEEKLSYIENYTIDIIISDVSDEGLWYNSAVVISTSVTPNNGFYMFAIGSIIWNDAALSWE